MAKINKQKQNCDNSNDKSGSNSSKSSKQTLKAVALTQTQTQTAKEAETRIMLTVTKATASSTTIATRAAATCIKNVKLLTTTKTITTTKTTTIAHRKQRNKGANNGDTRTRWQLQNVWKLACNEIRTSPRCSWLLLLPFLLLATHTLHVVAAADTLEDKQPQQQYKSQPLAKTTTAPLALSTTASVRDSTAKYSQPLQMAWNSKSDSDDNDSFRPIIPKDINAEYISRNVFTETGQYRVFQPVDSDLRAATTMQRKTYDIEAAQNSFTNVTSAKHAAYKSTKKISGPETAATDITTKAALVTVRKNTNAEIYNSSNNDLNSKTKQRRPFLHSNPSNIPSSSSITTERPHKDQLEALLVDYVENFFNKGQYEPTPELVHVLQNNHTSNTLTYSHTNTKHNVDASNINNNANRNRSVRHAIKRNDDNISIDIPRALESGRLLFFSGLKKVLWPIYMGMQILKSLLFALFLPTLIGSFGKLLGKGITSGSAPLFIRPMDPPQDLDFKDNTFNFDDDNKFAVDDGSTGSSGGTKDEAYAYNQPAASQIQNTYAYNAASINNQVLSRYGMTEQQKMQDSYLSALQSIGSASFKNSNSLSGSSSGALGGAGGGYGAPTRTKPAAPANMNTFQTFQKVPASSLLLSNYDPFYSPLLSRLDSVFAQLKLNSENEVCREKLICLMYANPAKYAPYSNLVSAQLSRELNELRKPTSDNPDILRFFKYMRAAKDGQDGVDCENTFDRCKEFKDFENPAMLSTYNDINKLVQARKMT